MRKKIIIVFCVVALSLFFVSPGLAEKPDKDFGIGARLSITFPEDDTVQGITFDPDESIFFEGMIQYLANDWFSMECSIGYTKRDVNSELLGISLDFGELEQIPILLTGRLHYWFPNSKTTLYGGAGVGLYINDFELSSLFKSAIPGADVDADNSLGFHLNAGVEFFVTDNIALDLDAKYIWNKADFDFKDATGTETEEIDLNGFVVGFSFKYFF